MQDELTAAIAEDLGINGLPPKEQQELITQFGEVALKAATLAVFEKLVPEKRDEFAKLAGAGDANALKVFLDHEVPAHETVVKAAVADEIKRFKDFQSRDAV
ncbi:hypothetical protein HKL94_02445 [Candidatus Parcubacteria bacterium]|nr:hypothetical protein [Candidatus Parcubacteria bacterium]